MSKIKIKGFRVKQESGKYSNDIYTLGPVNIDDGNGEGSLKTIGVDQEDNTLGQYSFSEGFSTLALGNYSHAQGWNTNTTVNGMAAHAEGNGTIASGPYSHAEGNLTTASGQTSHAQNLGTIASSDNQTALGRYNIEDDNDRYAMIIGNGTASERSNAAMLDWNGNLYLSGQIKNSSGENIYNNNLKNLVDGNAEGSLRSINSKEQYSSIIVESDVQSGVVEEDSTFTIDISSIPVDLRDSLSVFIRTSASQDMSSATDYELIDDWTLDSATSIISYIALGSTSQAKVGMSRVGMATVGQEGASEEETEHPYFAQLKVESESYSLGEDSFSEGHSTKASGNWSHAEGIYSIASGNPSHAEGQKTIASGSWSHAEGQNTIASGDWSHAEGSSTTASGSVAHVEGISTIASGQASHAEGKQTEALGIFSHTEGYKTKASGNRSHAEGQETIASGNYSHAEGYNTTASKVGSHAEGYKTEASGYQSHAEGGSTIASGGMAHAEGAYTIASGDQSHAEGYKTEASGDYSHAEGYTTIASRDYSHAEGDRATASGDCSHAEGQNTTASGDHSHAEGNKTTASGHDSHAEGFGTIASGDYSHAEGYQTTASGRYSHAQNRATIAASEYQTALGKYNISDPYNRYAVIIGNGTINGRSNAFTVDWQGDTYIDGALDVQLGITSTSNAYFLDNVYVGNNKYEWNEGTGCFIGSDGSIVLQATTSESNAYDSNNPHITFLSDSGDQGIQLIFTDYDTIQRPASLTLVGNQGGEYFITPNIRATDHIEIGTSSDTATRYIRVQNSLQNLAFETASSGNAGIWSSTHNRWLTWINSSGDCVLGNGAGQAITYSYVGQGCPIVSNETANHRVADFYMSSATSLRVQAQGNASSYAFYYITAGSSDIRLKENIADTETEALSLINKIRMRQFDWKADGVHQKIGMIADEVEKLDNRLTIGGGCDEDGTMNIKTIDTFYLTGYLVKAVQELSARVEELERRNKNNVVQ